MKGYITKQRNNRYMFTRKVPTVVNMDGMETKDAYITPGDPGGFTNMCETYTVFIFGEEILELNELESVRVEITGKTIK